MQVTSDLYKELLSSNHRTEIRLCIGEIGKLITKQGETITFGGTSILVGSAGADNGYDESLLVSMGTAVRVFSEDTPSVGGCVSGEIDIEMHKPRSEIPKQARLVPYVRLTDGRRHSEWIQKGVFFADTRSKKEDNKGIAHYEPEVEEETVSEESEATQEDTASCGTKFQIGDRVKIPSKQLTIGVVSDIWSSLAKQSIMYAVNTEDGRSCLYAEDQLEPAPLPIEYTFSAIIEDNVAVVCMIAHQGEKTWVYARGHAHILHDGAVGEAQAVSYAARRMFESLDTKQDNPIYFKGDK